MYHLATVFPSVRRIHLPVSRDQLMLLMMAINLFFLGIDIYLAHSISGTLTTNEWIPVVFGPIAGLLILLAGLIAFKNRPLATVLATIVFLASIGVGLLGDFFHIMRAILPNAPAGERVTIDLLVWAPPILGPLMFALVGLLGISAAWAEDPSDSGNLILLGGRRLQLPYSKTRAYFFMIGMGTLATVISSVLDHARTQFQNPWLWLPTLAGVLGVVVAIGIGIFEKPRRSDIIVYMGAMILLVVVGLIGALLHVNFNLIAEGTVVVERFISGAPFLAPLLFANMGLLGLLVLLDPAEKKR